MTAPSFLTVDLPCDLALQAATKKLLQTGLRALQTFDLHTARLAQQECPCPNHGTTKCDCQLVVLMVYGDSPEPTTLILHGSDGKTWFSLAEVPSQKADKRLADSIKQALSFHAFGVVTA